MPSSRLAFDPATVGAPGSHAPAELYRPEGAGPFPAIVLLHGCDGVGPHYRTWARRLTTWGYVVMLVDSFGPRNIKMVCNRGRDVPPELRAQDALAAADYLRALPEVRASRIGVIGFSHGGWTVLKSVLSSDAGVEVAHPFTAAVAFYPGCETPRSSLLTDTLILIGDADDWTPVARCERWRDTVTRHDHTVDLIVYHGAMHGFDSERPPHAYAGHMVGQDSAAAREAIARTRAFFQDRLATP
ncbi:dienelactone hydrolase [Cupriavidus basilensis OR16]|uniref:Dienelactone hydrolase n=1 Tax=Cupriavidus basilensis OR16 TaxID=1127483 RepID=H1S656_9BURK|nr:dienelactone hydrolase [Cupriavidus basilensis OR16]